MLARGASRDELTEALWPGQDPRRPGNTCGNQPATHAPRSATPGWSKASYRLDRSKVCIDLDRLLANTEPADEPQALEAARELWRGGSDYAWADGHVHRLRATLIGLLERAGNARLERGDALELAERAIASHSYLAPHQGCSCSTDVREGSYQAHPGGSALVAGSSVR